MAEPRDRKQSREGKCCSAWCMNAPVSGRRYCHKCRSRKYKYSQPHRYSYNLLRCGAKKRGIAFSLTFEEYVELWDRHPSQWQDKLANLWASNSVQGRSDRDTWEIDRIDNSRGYEASNVQILKKHMNASKGARGEWIFGGDGTKNKPKDNSYICPF